MILSELLKELELSTYIAFDFETTGLSPENDRIIEIAAIKFVEGQAVDRFVTLVNPQQQIESLITDLTGISNAMVSNAPIEEHIIDDLLDFLEEWPLVAHNISFDISFLNALCTRYSKPVTEHDLYDTLQLARSYLFFHPNHNLGSVAEFFKLSAVGAHRAELDTENTGIIFQRLVHEAASYPLEVSSKILSLYKNFEFPNHKLYIHLSQSLKKTGDLKKGLVQSVIDKPLYNNIFVSTGKNNLSAINVEDVFGEEGLLSKTLPAFEPRKSQQEYSAFVSRMLNEDRSFSAIEAGTGLGKSVAYLFPALQKAFNGENPSPVVISCHTKHLQDQLFTKDLPLLAKALDVSFHAMILKGRNNYICLTRFNWLLKDASQLLRKDEIESLFPLIVWMHITETGDLSECSGFWGYQPYKVVEMFQSEPGYCTTTVCNLNHGCYFGKIRQSVQESQVIIVNHALLLSVINNPGILPEFESVIIDEAHNLVDVAYDQLTLGVNQFKINSVLDIFDPATTSANRWVHKLEAHYDQTIELKRHMKDLQEQCKNGREKSKNLFENLSESVLELFRQDTPYMQYNIFKDIHEGYHHVLNLVQEFELTLSEIGNSIKEINKHLHNLDPENKDLMEIKQLFEHGAETLETMHTEFSAITQQQQNGWVYWQQGEFKNLKGGNKELLLSLNAAPIDIAADLHQTFFNNLRHCILTSATLRVEESFDYFLNRTGLSFIENELVHVMEFHSPFFYEDQVSYFQYAGKNGQNPQLIAELIHRLHHDRQKRIMALFTARQALNQVYHELLRKPNGRKLPLFAQTGGTSRFAMLQGMHRTPNGILLGTNAFWEGVDLPRELLEILIITKLPFSVPTEPKVQAYSSLLDERGSNSFIEFSVPEAVIKFRQGFGRLIRTIDDEGIFIVMDERVVEKKYGAMFSDAIPVRMKTFKHCDELFI